MKDRNTKFTALGMSNCGKTCYILGMYYVMASGFKGWTLLTENAIADKLARWATKIDTIEGMDKFPPSSPLDICENYKFGLYYINKLIMNFEWIDYAGSNLEHVSGPDFQKIEKSLAESSAIYIFIDGAELCDEDQKKRMRTVGNNCARYIQPCITKFMNSHKGERPPVVFVITKFDLCRKYIDTEDMNKILKEKFSSVYLDPDSKIYVTSVSLGINISDDDYNGEVDPVRIHIPFFIGIYHKLVEQYKSLTEDEKRLEGELYRKMINNIVSALNDVKDEFEIIRNGQVKEFSLENWLVS